MIMACGSLGQNGNLPADEGKRNREPIRYSGSNNIDKVGWRSVLLASFAIKQLVCRSRIWRSLHIQSSVSDESFLGSFFLSLLTFDGRIFSEKEISCPLDSRLDSVSLKKGRSIILEPSSVSFFIASKRDLIKSSFILRRLLSYATSTSILNFSLSIGIS
jgi:hypothetical protein